VLGATGHLGQAVVRDLIARNHRVTAATRQATPIALAGLDVRVARGDADVPGQLEAWVAEHDVVVDAAAPSPLGLTGQHRDPVAHARRRTRALFDAVERHGAQLVFVSSFTTLRRPTDAVRAMESRWRHGIYPYFRVKQLMEDMVLEAARLGVPAVVVNPSAFLGPWQYHPERSSFVRMVLDRQLPAAMHHVINVIDVRDVAAGIHTALEARRYGIQIPLSGHNIAVDDLALRLSAIGRVPPPAFRAETRATAVAAFWIEAAMALTGRQAPDAWRAAPLIADAWPMEYSAEQRALGVHVRALDETLRDAVAWHLGHRAS